MYSINCNNLWILSICFPQVISWALLSSHLVIQSWGLAWKQWSWCIRKNRLTKYVLPLFLINFVHTVSVMTIEIGPALRGHGLYTTCDIISHMSDMYVFWSSTHEMGESLLIEPKGAKGWHFLSKSKKPWPSLPGKNKFCLLYTSRLLHLAAIRIGKSEI